MHTELLQNGEVLKRMAMLFVPPAVAFLFSLIWLFAKKKDVESWGIGGEELNASAMLFLSVCATSFMYAVVENLLLLHNVGITAEKIVGTSFGFFALIGLVNAASCLVKGIIGGRMLRSCVGQEKQKGLSKALLYMAAAEVPGLIVLVLYMMKMIR